MAFKDHLEIYFPVIRGSLVWTHIANQGRSPQQGDKLKKMGVKAGWFDYIFASHPSIWKFIALEAKTKGKDYSDSQKDYIFFTEGVPIFKGKFYSVEEGHKLLLEAGVIPVKECTYFKEPSYITKRDRINMSKQWTELMYKRRDND